jgi:plastocyanin domain-containing protein
VGNNVIEFTPKKPGIIPYSCWMGMIRSQITVVAGAAETQATEPAATSASEKLANTGDPAPTYSDLYNGNCCLIKPVSPGAAKPEEIKRAYVAANGEQQATITVDSYGYSPQILVIQRGLVTNIKFDVRQATSCNEKVYIAEFDLQLDLVKDNSVPPFTAENDFRISCWMNMISMNVIVVDDLQNVDLQAIQAEVQSASQNNGGGCCG